MKKWCRIVNIILALAIIFGAYTVQSVVEQDEYYTEYEYEETLVTDEYVTHFEMVAIEGSEYQVKSPNYVDGLARDVCEVLYNVLPYGHISEYAYITNDRFAYNYYDNF